MNNTNDTYIFNSKEILGQSLIHAINLSLPKQSTIVEIGTWYAQTACMIAQKCNNVSTIYTVDPYVPYYNYLSNMEVNKKDIEFAKMTAKHNIQYSGFSEKIKLIESTSIIFAKTIKDESIDLVFLDSEIDKKSAIDDMNAWYPKLKPGGILCGHHYSQIEDMVFNFKNKIGNKNILSINDDVWAWVK